MEMLTKKKELGAEARSRDQIAHSLHRVLEGLEGSRNIVSILIESNCRASIISREAFPPSQIKMFERYFTVETVEKIRLESEERDGAQQDDKFLFRARLCTKDKSGALARR